MLDFKHTFNFFQATLIKAVDRKKSSQQLESASISHFKHIIKPCFGFYQISSDLADIILHGNNREIKNGWEKENVYNEN